MSSEHSSTIRGWLIFFGLAVLIVALNVLKFPFRMAMAFALRIGLPLLIVGAVIVLLGWRPWKRNKGEKEE